MILSDSSDDSHGHDFIVCSAGTDNYEILVAFESLDIRRKDRVKVL